MVNKQVLNMVEAAGVHSRAENRLFTNALAQADANIIDSDSMAFTLKIFPCCSC